MHEFSLLAFLQGLPIVIQVGCAGLLTSTLAFAIALWRSSSKLTGELREFAAIFDDHQVTEMGQQQGMVLERLDSLRVKADSLKGLRASWWHRLTPNIEAYTGTAEDEAFFLVESPRDLLAYDWTVGRNFNGPLFSVIPGILTGVGLMLTFLAILIALVNVHYDKSNTIEPITGIDALINGLSGKFTSSILALSLSILFTFYEKDRIRRVRAAYEGVLAAVSRAIPTLSSSRILLDIRKSSSDASVSVAHISAEVVERFTNAINEKVVPGLASGMSLGIASVLQQELSPTMERMTGSLDGLQGAIVRLESQKQESVTGEFGRMVTGLEESITRALGGMAERFHEALSGSARQEFGNIQGTLEGTRQVLSDLNGQFVGMQDAFNAVVAKAEETTASQLSRGREETEALSGVMQGLMQKLEETAGQNLSLMQSQLSRVVEDLTGKVAKISEEMMSAAQAVTLQSQQSTSGILEKIETSSSTTAKRLEVLLSGIEDRSKDFREASTALLEAKTFVNSVLQENGKALGQMAEASRQIAAFGESLKVQTAAFKSTGESQRNITTTLDEATSRLTKTLEAQQGQLAEYEGKIQQFTQVVDGLDTSIANIMKATSEGLRDYNEKVRLNFQAIVDAADKLVPQAAQMLQTQIEQFSEQLEGLNDTFSKELGKLNGRR
jgi:uncharacterized protein YukE